MAFSSAEAVGNPALLKLANVLGAAFVRFSTHMIKLHDVLARPVPFQAAGTGATGRTVTALTNLTGSFTSANFQVSQATNGTELIQHT